MLWQRIGRVLRRPGIVSALVALLFFVATVALRDPILAEWNWVNPDEAELLAQARAALDSPVPFTTWTLATTGPVWPLLLAGFAAVGFPLTIAFGHLLAALFWALSAWLVFILARRPLGAWWGFMFALAWWVPVAIVWPVGHPTNFGVLNTETLPVLLILAAAVWPPELLARRPALFLFVGAIGALAIGAKYQAAPIVLVVVIIQLLALRRPVRHLLTPLLFWIAGGVGVAAAFGLAMVTSPAFSPDLLQQNISFIGSYADNLGLQARMANSTTLIARSWFFWVLLVAVIVLCVLSTRRVAIARLALVGVGVATVYGGGMGFPHYLQFLFLAMGLALALPLRDGVRLPEAPVARGVTAGIAFIAVAGLVTVTTFDVPGSIRLPRPETLAASLSPDSVIRSDALGDACPAGSAAFVWGWAPELLRSVRLAHDDALHERVSVPQ